MDVKNGYTVGCADSLPWGHWRVLSAQAGFTCKEIVIHPGESLSLQRHNYRRERWTILSGEAQITLRDEVTVCKTGDLIAIDAGEVHCAKNIGNCPLIILEAQLGNYLDESDIERLSDPYHRT